MRKILTFIVILILVSVNANLLKGSYESSQKLSELNQEVGKVKALEIKNQDLKKELTERNSSFFIEQEARNRLGYGREGETAIVIESSAINEDSVEKQNKADSNWQAWLELIRN